MWIGTGGGLWRFDGAHWTLTPGTEGVVCRSIVRLASNRLLVTLHNSFGIVAPGADGLYRYEALDTALTPSQRPPTQLRRIRVVGGHFYVVADPGLYVGRFDTNRPVEDAAQQFPEAFGLLHPTIIDAFAMGEVLLVHDSEAGLMQVVGETMVSFPDGSRYAEARIAFVEQVSADAWLIGLRDGRLLRYDGSQLLPWATNAHDFLATHMVNTAVVLHDGNIAIGTERGGLVVLDPEGQLLHIWDAHTVLQDPFVVTLLQDHQGGLWVGQNRNLSRLAYATPVRHYAYDRVMQGGISDLSRHEGALYLTSPIGLFRLDASTKPGEVPSFTAVPGLEGYGAELEAVDATLFVGSFAQLYRASLQAAVPLPGVSIDDGVYDIQRSRRDSGRVYVTVPSGRVLLYRQTQGQWEVESELGDLGVSPWRLAEDANGGLWVGTVASGVLYFPDPTDRASRQQFGAAEGLVDGRVFVRPLGDRLVFTTAEGLRRFDAETNRFVPETAFGETLARAQVDFFQEMPDREVWAKVPQVDAAEFWRLRPRPDDTYAREPAPMLHRLGPYLGSTWNVYPDPLLPGTVWLASAEGLVGYNTQVALPAIDEVPTLLSHLTLNDSLLMGREEMQDFRVPAGRSTVRIAYATPSYEAFASNAYQVWLDGRDAGWSEWGTLPWKEYTDLSPGAYRLRVRSRNAYGVVGPEAEVAFRVMPPWYRTGWMYAGYGLGILGLVFGLAFVLNQRRTRQLRQRNRELEDAVAERTTELQAHQDLLAQQNAQLRQLDEAKSQFFANISHEFRTPLTLTFGPIEDLLKGRYEVAPEARPHLERARRNGHRLLRLINQLLDLSRLDAGALRLNAQQHNLVAFLEQRVGAFADMAAVRGLTLRYVPDVPEIVYVFDAEKLETVLLNLLSNAFKFTPRGGSVVVSARQDAHGEALITVRDTGIGIPSAHLPHLFDRFYQVDGSTTRKRDGSGIGLALSRQLVELHEGSLTVASTVGEGTTFTLTLGLVAPTPSSQGDGSVIPGASAPVPARTPEVEPFPVPAPVLAQAAPSVPPAGSASDESAVILVVEDNTDMRAYIRAHLEGRYRVAEAVHGKAGLEQAVALVPDLILSDVMMPHMDGLDLLQAIREDERTSHIPVILLTARADVESRIVGLSTGADAYLAKPFHAEELQAHVTGLITQRQRLRERYSQQSLTLTVQEATLPSMDAAFLERLQGIINEHLGTVTFGVDALAEEMGLSRRQLLRKVKALLDQTPNQLIRQLRMERAGQLLAAEIATVKEVAYQVGFRSDSQFRKAFHAHFGMSPTAYMTANEDNSG